MMFLYHPCLPRPAAKPVGVFYVPYRHICHVHHETGTCTAPGRKCLKNDLVRQRKANGWRRTTRTGQQLKNREIQVLSYQMRNLKCQPRQRNPHGPDTGHRRQAQKRGDPLAAPIVFKHRSHGNRHTNLINYPNIEENNGCTNVVQMAFFVL
jgi:hypothetical protein